MYIYIYIHIYTHKHIFMYVLEQTNNLNSFNKSPDPRHLTVDFRNFIVFYWAETLAH